MRIEQTLHGYYKGHGLLASSLSHIELEDNSLMSVLSDWTGYRGKETADDSYITAYPLPSGDYFAIAKSWYAFEMERPGCVWTHTLLIPYIELHNNFDFRNIHKLFFRPKSQDFNKYRTALDIDDKEVCQFKGIPIFEKFDKLTLLFLFTFLVSKNKGAIIKIERNQYELQGLMLSFLQYLPLGILKETSISTGSEAPRKFGNDQFSMQFVTGGQSISIEDNAPWDGKITLGDFNIGLRYVIDEAYKHEDETSYLVRVFNNDIGENGDKFIAVTNLLRLLDVALKGEQKEELYEDVLTCILGFFPSSKDGYTVKTNFFKERVTKLFCSERVFFLSVSKQNKISEENLVLMDFNERLRALKDNNIIDFIELINSLASVKEPSDVACKILMYGLETLEIQDINRIIENNWPTMFALAFSNGSYVQKGYWIKLEKEKFELFFLPLNIEEIKNFEHWDELLDKVLETGALIKEDQSHFLIKNAGNSITKILDKANMTVQCFISPFLLFSCSKDVGECINWISCHTPHSKTIVRFFTNYIVPSSKDVRQSSSSIWLPLVDMDDGNLDYSYYSFILVLAFNWNDRNSISFFSHSFERIYIALSNDELPEREWKKIEPFTEDLGVIFEWDKCKKISSGVVSYLKRNGVNIGIIERISTKKKIKQRLYKMWGS